MSGVGDDANPCSRTAPCKTFAGAISKTADCGEIDALDPGGFGTVTITKGIKIDGGGGEAGQVASILAGTGTPGVTINNQSSACNFDVLRNLDIQGVKAGTTGVNILAGGRVSIENVDVENFTNLCVDFEPSTAMSLVIYNSNFEQCTNGGLKIGSAAGVRANIDKSTIQRHGFAGNGPGVGEGIEAVATSFVNVHNTMVVNNLGGGIEGNGPSVKVMIDLSNVANNQGNGVHASNSSTVGVSNTSVAFNSGFGFLADPGSNLLTGNNNWLTGNGTDGVRTGLLTVQ
ncbi:MAG TPA: right-handed parallel beta-helix repeat-containing protein [Candidatus Elarobacter sp.]|nr:right-handed parallel beta-helix repeat-containing protein [Candidatus Elarobacter sp.]